MKFDTKSTEDKMMKSIAAYEENLSTIRVGRASAAVISRVTVDYYGTPTAITQVGEVKVVDAKTLLIQPWDTTLLKGIERALLASDVGITPQNDGKVIRLVFPQLNEDRRRELTKQTAKMGEEAKVAIRNIRREAVEKCKDLKKSSEMTEDELKHSEKEIQDVTDRYTKKIDAITEAKDKEIMSI